MVLASTSLLLLHAGSSRSNGGGGLPPSPFPTGSPTPTPSFSVTPIPTFTLTPTPSSTLTPIPTFTITPTPTESPTTTASPTPTVTSSPTPTPTVMPDGIYVFGSNNQGQAGLDSTGILTAITYFSNLNVYQRKIADGNTTGFIKTDNTLWLAGDNDVGQCAQNNFINYSSPVQEITGGQWEQISSGNKFMVATKQDGSLWSWGQNTSGQLGDNTTISRTSPVREATSEVWDYVSAGYEFVLATRLGRLYAWGNNSSGQLGISNNANVSVPTQIGTATDWQLPAAGYLTAGCIKTDGTLWTWGSATSGVLGNNVTVSRSSPVQVGSDNTWTTIYASYNNFYAQKGDSTVWGWGVNTSGQLAQNNVINRSSPVLLGTYNYYYPIINNIYTIDVNNKLWGAGSYLSGKLLTRNGLPGNGNASSLIQLGNVGYEWLNFAVQGAANNNTIRLIGNAVPTPTPSGTGPTPTATLSPTPTPTATFPPTPAPTNTLTPTVTGSPAPTGTATPTPAPPTPSSTAPTPTPSIAPLADQFYVWGDNTSGEYGNNTQAGITQRSTPIFIAVSDWATIPSGGDSISGVKNNGTLYMWGLNSSGELGQNNIINRSTPTQVGVSSDWSWVMNDRFTIGVKTNGTLWAWGNNINGQLGLNDIVSRSSPVQIGADNTWSRVYVSRFYSGAAFDSAFAIKTNGSLWAWGNNSAGQLGFIDAVNRSSPIQVGADLNWSSVAVSGQRFALAIKTNGTLWSCGINTNGSLGINNSINRSSWTQVGTNSNWTQVSADYWPVGAIKSDGTLWTWGQNTNGSLGSNIGSVFNRSSPAQVGIETTWNQIECGYASMLGRKVDGTLWSWGTGSAGQLGNNTTQNQSSPVLVSGGLNWFTCSANNRTSFGIVRINAATSTPTATIASTPTPTPSPSESPIPTTTLSPTVTESPTPTTTASPTPTPSPTAFNAWYLWSSNLQGQLNTGDKIAVQGPYNAFSAGDYPNIESGSSSTFLKFDGTLWGCGINNSGALGQNDTILRSSIVQIATNVVYNTANQNFINFIKNDGTLWGCGTNNGGQLGVNAAINYSSPTQETLGKTDWVKCVVGVSASFAIDSSNRLYSTGNNTAGTLGLNIVANQSQFIQVGTDTTWFNISCGNTTAIALKTDGSLWTWGSNSVGQIGDETIINRSSPVQIGMGSIWSKVASAGFTCLALKSDNTLWGWGNNSSGQLGDADPTYTSISSPIQILTGTWLDMDMGNSACFAINTNNELWGSGNSSAGTPNLFTYLSQSSFVMLDNVRQWLSFSQVKGQNNNSMNAKALGPVAGTPTPTPSPTLNPTPTPTIAPSSNIVGMSGSANLEAYGQNNGDFFVVLTPNGTDVSSTFRVVVWNAALNEWLCTTDSGKFYYSTDGQNWTLAGTITGFCNGMTFGYNAAGIPMVVFTVQIAINDFRVGYTYDNRNFTVGTESFTDAIYSINYAGGNFITLSIIAGEGVYKSCDGVNYIEVGTIPYAEIYNLAYNPTNNRLVGCVGIGGVDVTNKAIYSDDYGATWTNATLPQIAPYRTCVWTGSNFAAINAYYGYVALSNDGITWTLGNFMLGAGNNLHKMCYYNGALYVMGLNYSIMWKSANQGVTWSQINLGTNSSWSTISGQEPLPTPNAPTCPPTTTASPTPSPSASPEPTPTPTSSPTPSESPSPTPTESPTPSPSPSPSESLTPSPTATPTSTPTPSPSESPSPTPSPSATCTPVPLPVTSGLVGWFDASNTATINGGNPTNGVAVSSWGNSTTNATWAGMIQSTAAKQPTYFSDNTVAGSYVLFDNTAGANADGMTTNGAYSLSGACTIVVMEDAPASISPSHRTIQSSSINALISLNQYGGPTPIGCFYGASIVSGYQSGTGKHNGIMTKSAANAIKYYVDGTNKTSGTPTSTSNWAQVCFGGAGANANEPANTKVLEVIVYDRELSAAEVTQVSDYLQCKYTNPGPTPQPTIGPATASPTPSPSVAPATATPTPSPSASETPTPSPSASETPSPTPSASEAPATPTPSPTIGTVSTWWGWGANTGGSLSIGNTNQVTGLYNPQPSDFTQICIGTAFFGLKADNTLWVCGSNTSGQLGLGDVIPRSSMVQATGSWTRAIGNVNMSSGIKTDGTLWTWGAAGQGSAAINVATMNASTPVQEILGKTDWVTHFIGSTSQLAIDSAGKLWTVGSDANGNQGLNTLNVAKSTFTQIGAGTDWSSTFVSNGFSAALKTNGSVYVWGVNTVGQIGDGTVISKSSPVQVVSDKTISKIVGSSGGIILLDTSGNLWGTGQQQLGLNDITPRSSYTQIASGVLDACANGSNILFIKTDNTLWGVGSGGSPLLNASLVNVSSPIMLDNTFSWQYFNSVRGTFQSQTYAYANGLPQATPTVTASPTPTPTPSATPEALNWWGWGAGTNGQMGNNGISNINALNNFYPSSVYADVAIGNNGLFKKQDGTLWQAGLNSYGRLGINSTVNQSSQIQITGANFASFGIANVQTRIFPNGTLWCAGQGTNGGLATNSVINQSSPVQESLGKTDWVKSFGFSNCQIALDSSGRLWSCGFNLQGQLGKSDLINRSQFVQIGADTNWVDVTVGVVNFIAKKNNNTYWTCGVNTTGQFGLNNIISASSPIQIGGAYTIQKIAGGSTLTFILDNAGNIFGCGSNGSGTIGDGTTISKSSWVQMIGGPWIDVKPCATAVFMIKSDNTLWAVGAVNANLSLGTFANAQSSPVMIDNTKTWLRFSEQVPGSNSMSAQGVQAGFPTPTPT